MIAAWVPKGPPSFQDASSKPGAPQNVATPPATSEFESLRSRAAAGETLTPVEQGTMLRLSAAAAPKVKTSADFSVTGATPDDIKQLDAALKYLSASPTAATLLDRLPAGAKLAIDHHGNHSYDLVTKTISWDPLRGALVNDGKGVVSPAVILAHEIDHALAGIPPVATFDRYDNTEEKRVITGS